MKKEAYYYYNTDELREWLKGLGLSPISYPDCDRLGITAPYCGLYYKDGVRYKDDDDADIFHICESEEEFKNFVLELIKK